MGERSKKFFSDKPRLRKIVGVILVLIGVFAFITPLTPGSWLALIGLELLGVDLIFWDKIKRWFWRRKINSSLKTVANEKINANEVAIFGGGSPKQYIGMSATGQGFFQKQPKVSSYSKTVVSDKKTKSEIAIFGGGCFWCTEAVFKMLRGVSEVLPGYAGGTVENPTYEQVSTGKTEHAEVVRITYNPKLMTYKDLLTVFFGSHDSTTLNRQGNDVGAQYRSVIFYTTEVQKKTAEDFIAEINASNKHGAPVVTELDPLTEFYEAENYHRDYFATHPGNPYCEVVINPKLEKVQKEFAELLNSHK